MAKKESELYLGGGSNLNFQTTKLITTHNTLKLITLSNGTINLDVKIEADFDTVPEQYHEVFLNMMSAKYLDTVSFGDNPFSQCIPPPKKKWWQFWKTSVNI
jgi:hypothetical protein